MRRYHFSAGSDPVYRANKNASLGINNLHLNPRTKKMEYCIVSI